MRLKLTRLIQIIVTVVTIVIVPSAIFAQTYYVRTDGGTSSECTGLVDAAYPGSGAAQSCAWKSPMIALPPYDHSGNPTGTPLISGGDTLIIKNGDYKIGAQDWAVNEFNYCSYTSASSCNMAPIPKGTPTNHTRILGEGYEDCQTIGVELYATRGLGVLLSLNDSDYVDVQCLRLTDHMACASSTSYSDDSRECINVDADGDWGNNGIQAADMYNWQTTTDVTLKDVEIRGLGANGIKASAYKNWTFDGVKIIANQMAGFDGEVSQKIVDWPRDDNPDDLGTMTFKDTELAWMGCIEGWPDTTVHDGCDSNYGDALGTFIVGGNWTFDNVYVHHVMSDGIDLLYHISRYSKLPFKNGSQEITPTTGYLDQVANNNQQLVGGTSNAVGTVVQVVVTSGTWAGGDAAGYIYMTSQWGDFTTDETITRPEGGSAVVSGSAIDLDPGTITVKNSRFEAVTGNCMKIRGNKVIYNNEVIHNCRYFSVGRGGENLIAPTPNNILLCRAGASTISAGLKYGNWVVVMNNSIITESSGGISIDGVVDTWGGHDRNMGTEEAWLYNNIFYAMQGDNHVTYADNVAAEYENSINYLNNIAYNNWDNTSFVDGNNNVIADPKFVHVSLDGNSVTTDDVFDIHILDDSPALDAGTNIGVDAGGHSTVPSVDRVGVTRTSPVTIGAYELATGVTPSCSNTASLCTNQTDCETANWYWYNDVCNSSPQQTAMTKSQFGTGTPALFGSGTPVLFGE